MNLEDPWTIQVLQDQDIPHVLAARVLRTSPDAVRKWRKRHSDGSAGPFSSTDRAMLHTRLDQLLDEASTDPKSVRAMRVTTWDGMIKNAEGQAETIRQYAVRLDASWSPTWEPVRQPDPILVSLPDHLGPRLTGREEKIAVILPDTQIGYRYYADADDYDPFHDEKALAVAQEIVRDIEPDKLIFLGDFLDLPTFSKYEQEPAFARTTQRSLDYGYRLLSEYRAILPRTEIVMLEGNHDRRLEKMVTRNAMEAFGLRRASDEPGWPVLSLPHLLRLGELGVQYVGGYPAGSFWINDRLKCIHGSVVRSSGSTAKAVADAERVSVIFGHIHRIETHYKTADVREGGRVRLAHTPGCLCRIDGAVPSFKGSTDLSGRPVTHYEDWQQGLSVVTYRDGDSPFSLESVFINTFEDYRTTYGAQIYSGT